MPEAIGHRRIRQKSGAERLLATVHGLERNTGAGIHWQRTAAQPEPYILIASQTKRKVGPTANLDRRAFVCPQFKLGYLCCLSGVSR